MSKTQALLFDTEIIRLRTRNPKHATFPVSARTQTPTKKKNSYIKEAFLSGVKKGSFSGKLADRFFRNIRLSGVKI
jgi:hypothetical protein